MKKLFYYFFCLILTGSILIIDHQKADASGPRMDGMSLYSGYRWMIQKDFTYIDENPAYAVQFAPMIWGAWTSADSTGSGALLISPVSNLAIYVKTGNAITSQLNSNTLSNGMFNTTGGGNYTPASQLTSAIATADDVTANTSGKTLNREQVSIDAAYKLNIIVLGCTAGYSRTQDKDTTKPATAPILMIDNHEYTRSQWHLGAGAYLDIGSGMDIDASLKYVSLGLDNQSKYTDSTNIGESTYKDNGELFSLGFLGSANMTLQLRFNIATSETNRIHIFHMTQFWNYSTQSDSNSITAGATGSDDYKRKGRTHILGISDERKITKNAMVFIGGQVEYYKSQFEYSGEGVGYSSGAIPMSTNYENESSMFNVPLIFGAESKLTDNWIGRIGAYHSLRLSDKSNGNATTISTIPTAIAFDSEDEYDVENSTVVSIGGSYKLEKFKFEWVISKSLFTDGPYLIGGVSNVGIASSFIAIYLF